MPRPAFDEGDLAQAIGPPAAFDPDAASTPGTYALQHHLALEIVAHLRQDGVPFVFRGGTALHTRLTERTRFSSDVDVTTSDATAVADALRRFAGRFRRSAVRLQEPPDDLRIDGVRHVLDFGRTQAQGEPVPVRILVEVVEVEEPGGTAPLPLRADGHDWGVDVDAPTYDGFVGQKLAVLGPTTIGKPVGLNEAHAIQNQGVCKQIFDLRALLGQDLDADAVAQSYEDAVAEANALRGSSFGSAECLEDATGLLARLRRPRTTDKSDPVRYGLWAGWRDSRRWIVATARDGWGEREYRIAGGVVSRLAAAVRHRDFDLHTVRAPLVQDVVPVHILRGVEQARTSAADWFSEEDFGADAVLAWAWAPPGLWA